MVKGVYGAAVRPETAWRWGLNDAGCWLALRTRFPVGRAAPGVAPPWSVRRVREMVGVLERMRRDGDQVGHLSYAAVLEQATGFPRAFDAVRREAGRRAPGALPARTLALCVTHYARVSHAAQATADLRTLAARGGAGAVLPHHLDAVCAALAAEPGARFAEVSAVFQEFLPHPRPEQVVALAATCRGAAAAARLIGSLSPGDGVCPVAAAAALLAAEDRADAAGGCAGTVAPALQAQAALLAVEATLEEGSRARRCRDSERRSLRKGLRHYAALCGRRGASSEFLSAYARVRYAFAKEEGVHNLALRHALAGLERCRGADTAAAARQQQQQHKSLWEAVVAEVAGGGSDAEFCSAALQHYAKEGRGREAALFARRLEAALDDGGSVPEGGAEGVKLVGSRRRLLLREAERLVAAAASCAAGDAAASDEAAAAAVWDEGGAAVQEEARSADIQSLCW